jgi:hypothetical protein
MAPAFGLYLAQLFFEGYNKKMRNEIANDLRLAAIRAAKQTQQQQQVAVAPTVAATSTTIATTPAAGEGGEQEEEEVVENAAKKQKVEEASVAEAVTEAVAESAPKPQQQSKPNKTEDEGQVNKRFSRTHVSSTQYFVTDCYHFRDTLQFSTFSIVSRRNCVEHGPRHRFCNGGLSQ